MISKEMNAKAYEKLYKYVEANRDTLRIEVNSSLNEGVSYTFVYKQWDDEEDGPLYVTAYDKDIFIGSSGAMITAEDESLKKLLFDAVTRQLLVQERRLSEIHANVINSVFGD